MTELTTIDTNNYAEMAKAMGMATDTGTKQKASTLARLRINHSPLMGQSEINGKNVNVEVVEGDIFETLDNFINKNKDLQISFVHFDLDIYDVTKFALKKIKPFLSKNAVILFDQIHHVQGWKNEYKALTEVLNENEYEFIAFSEDGQASILLKS